MKSLREYIDILDSIERLDEARPQRVPGPVTTTTYDKDGNPVSQTTEPPRWEEKRTYIVYKVPRDWAARRHKDPTLIDPYEIGLRYVSNSGRGKDYFLYRTSDENKNTEAERVFGPGQEIVKTVKPGTPQHKFDLPGAITPNTQFWNANKEKIKNNP